MATKKRATKKMPEGKNMHARTCSTAQSVCQHMWEVRCGCFGIGQGKAAALGKMRFTQLTRHHEKYDLFVLSSVLLPKSANQFYPQFVLIPVLSET